MGHCLHDYHSAAHTDQRLFAMSELAVISSSKTRLQRRAEEGNSNARAALDLAGNPHRFLATVQIGITLIGVLSGAFGGASLAGRLAQPLSSLPYIGRYSESIALALVVGLITYLSLLAELIPEKDRGIHPGGHCLGGCKADGKTLRNNFTHYPRTERFDGFRAALFQVRADEGSAHNRGGNPHAHRAGHGCRRF